jgi:UDP-N-acetylglucosamine:LPS N-acetylglucosamine transferase
MKTIFISIRDGDTEKNILRSEVFSQLKAKGHKIVILIRGGDRLQYYRDNFEGHNVEVVALPPASNKLEVLLNHVDWNSVPTYSVYLRRRDWYLDHKNIVRYTLERTLGFLGKFKLWRNLYRLFYWLVPDQYASELFERYKPDVVFAPNMFSPEDFRLLKAARKRGIPTITTVKSWDVLTTKAFTRVKADKILVFNEYNATEAVELGDYKKEQVVVTGFPQFDIYTHKELIIPRDEFCRAARLNPEKPFILFAVPGDWKMAHTDEVIKHLDDSIQSGQIPPVSILARVHPKYATRVEARTDYKHVIIDRPGTYFSKSSEHSMDTSQAKVAAWTFTDKDIVHLMNSIYHSAVTINIESTMTLDAAALDKPVVLVGYDGDHSLPYERSIVRNYDRNHFQYVIHAGGVKLAKNKDELTQVVRDYLNNPMLDHNEREILREKLIYKVDGKASARIAEAIESMI